MEKQIYKLNNWKYFLNESKNKSYNIEDKLSILKNYINILKQNPKENYNIAIQYFTFLHNILIVECDFLEDIMLCNKEINKHLKLEELYNDSDVYDKFLELYDIHNIIRNNIETLDSINILHDYFSKNPKLFNELLKKSNN